EPAAGRGPLMEAVLHECRREAKAGGHTVLLSSHILAQVEVLADRISIIRHGKIVESGTLNELRHLSRTAVTTQTAEPIAGLASLSGVHNLHEQAGQLHFDADPQHLPDIMREPS